MSDDAKPSRLSGLIAKKGEAARPTEQPQRAAAASSRSAPAKQPPAPPPPRPTSRGVKSLTLRLSDEDYERLRVYAFAQRATHQDVLAAALDEYLRSRE